MTNLETKASHKGEVIIPPALMDSYIIDRTGWTWHELRSTPHYITEQLHLIWHLQNIAGNHNSG